MVNQSVSVAPGFVEVAVHAVALNFKDVLNVLVPDDISYSGQVKTVDLPLPGGEFSGVVTRISEKESSFSAGDKVYGMGTGLLQSKQVVPTNYIGRMPFGFSFNEVSALSTVFLTVL